MISINPKFTHKLISGMTLFCFLFTQVSWALPSAGIAVLPQYETPSFLQVEIPADLASVEEVFEAPAQADPKLILHIQNIHGNYESQVQIKKILDYLYTTYGFKLLFAEGASEKLNPDFLRFFPESDRNEQFADYLTKKGELTGIEYYLINGPQDVEAVGIEQAELYRKNYEAFRKVYGAREEVNQFLESYESKLEMLASRIFPQNTRRLLSEWAKFEAGHRDFLPYIQRLTVDAKSVLGIDLQSLFAQVEWPQITRLLALQSIEKELDKTAAEKEKARLIEFLKTQKASPEIIEAIEKLSEKKMTAERLNQGEKKLEDLPRYLLERLAGEMGPKGFRFHDYPAFSLWAGHLILQNELDSRQLFEEIEKIFTTMLDEMSVTEREKNLLELYRDAILVRKLLHLELTRKEWDRVVYRKDWMTFTAMHGRLEKITEAIQGAGLTEVQNVDFGNLSKILETSYRFYDYARARETVFMEAIQKEMSARDTDKAVLVTGGFHTDGLMEIFRENEINVGVLTPRLTGTIDHSGYLSSMLENGPTAFDVETLEGNNILQRPATRVAQGANLEKLTDRMASRLGDFNNAQPKDFVEKVGKTWNFEVKLQESANGKKPRLSVTLKNPRAEAEVSPFEKKIGRPSRTDGPQTPTVPGKVAPSEKPTVRPDLLPNQGRSETRDEDQAHFDEIEDLATAAHVSDNDDADSDSDFPLLPEASGRELKADDYRYFVPRPIGTFGGHSQVMKKVKTEFETGHLKQVIVNGKTVSITKFKNPSAVVAKIQRTIFETPALNGPRAVRYERTWSRDFSTITFNPITKNSSDFPNVPSPRAESREIIATLETVPQKTDEEPLYNYTLQMGREAKEDLNKLFGSEWPEPHRIRYFIIANESGMLALARELVLDTHQLAFGTPEFNPVFKNNGRITGKEFQAEIAKAIKAEEIETRLIEYTRPAAWYSNPKSVSIAIQKIAFINEGFNIEIFATPFAKTNFERVSLRSSGKNKGFRVELISRISRTEAREAKLRLADVELRLTLYGGLLEIFVPRINKIYTPAVPKGQTFALGRSHEALVQFSEATPTISKIHAYITRSLDDKWYIRNNSRNNTFLEGGEQVSDQDTEIKFHEPVEESLAVTLPMEKVAQPIISPAPISVSSKVSISRPVSDAEVRNWHTLDYLGVNQPSTFWLDNAKLTLDYDASKLIQKNRGTDLFFTVTVKTNLPGQSIVRTLRVKRTESGRIVGGKNGGIVLTEGPDYQDQFKKVTDWFESLAGEIFNASNPKINTSRILPEKTVPHALSHVPQDLTIALDSQRSIELKLSARGITQLNAVADNRVTLDYSVSNAAGTIGIVQLVIDAKHTLISVAPMVDVTGSTVLVLLDDIIEAVVLLQRFIGQTFDETNSQLAVAEARTEHRVSLVDGHRAVKIVIHGTSIILGENTVGDQFIPNGTLTELAARLNRLVPQKLEAIRAELRNIDLEKTIEQSLVPEVLRRQRDLLLNELSRLNPPAVVTPKTTSATSQQIQEAINNIPLGMEGFKKYFLIAERDGLNAEELAAIPAGLTFKPAVDSADMKTTLTNFAQKVIKLDSTQEQTIQQLMNKNPGFQLPPSDKPAFVTVVLASDLKLESSDLLDDQTGIFDNLGALLVPYSRAELRVVILNETEQPLSQAYAAKIKGLREKLGNRFSVVASTRNRLADILAKDKHEATRALSKGKSKQTTDEINYWQLFVSGTDAGVRDLTDASSIVAQGQVFGMVTGDKKNVRELVPGAALVPVLASQELDKQLWELAGGKDKLVKKQIGYLSIVTTAIESFATQLSSLLQALKRIAVAA